MRNSLWIVALFVGVLGASAQSFTDINSPRYYGKTADKARNSVIDANLALLEAASASVADSGTISVSSGSVIVTGTGGANDTTNTVTISAGASSIGATVVIAVSSSSTNLITIADSGNAALSSAWVGDNNDTLTLYVVATNSLIEVSRSNN
jgi:hypothetical protein